MKTFRNVWAVALTLCLAMPAAAIVISGGKNAATDCFAQFNAEGVSVDSPGAASCEDGDSCDTDGAVDGKCTFSVTLCVDQATSGCTFPAAGVTAPKVKGPAKKAGLVPPTTLNAAACSSPVSIAVKLKGKGKNKGMKPGKVKLMAVTASAESKKLKDKDKVTLTCKKPEGPPAICPSTTDAGPAPSSCTPSALPNECPANPNGGPNEVILTSSPDNTDLDNGWTGVAHNFPVPSNSNVKLCLSGCDSSSNPVCDATGPTGTGSINGENFGPPLPLIANLVPVCVINNYQPGALTGKFNVQTGEVPVDTPVAVNLFSDTHFTSPQSVCPRCTGPNAGQVGGTGTCNSGKNQGQACTVESIIDVVQPNDTTTYQLSSSCPPATGDFAGRLDIKLRLTTETSSLGGPTPCQREPNGPAGVTVKDDACAQTACVEGNCTGNACVRRNADGKCVDSKGGISQACCTNNTAAPCFRTATASGGVICRTGRPDPAKSSNGQTWPDPTYPKHSCGAALVTTFCEGATQTGTINGSTGLPGPGALILPGVQTLLKR